MGTEPQGRTSYEEYVAARWNALVRTAYLLCADRDEAEDVVQSALVKCFVHWRRVSVADSVDAYVHKVIVNTVLDARRLRTRRQQRAHLLVSAAPAVADPSDHVDLWGRLSELPPRQRAVLVLRYYEDLSEAEIATVLGCSRGTVKSQAHDALRRLRAGIGEVEVAR